MHEPKNDKSLGSLENVIRVKHALARLAARVNEEVLIKTESKFIEGEGYFRIVDMGSIPEIPEIGIRWSKPSLTIPPLRTEQREKQWRFLYAGGNFSSLDEFLATAKNTTSELLTFAHEYGHFLSYTRGYRSASYRAALDRFNEGRLRSREDYYLIMNEESRAWSFGFSALKSLGYRKTKKFRRAKARALQIYRIRLGWQMNARGDIPAPPEVDPCISD